MIRMSKITGDSKYEDAVSGVVNLLKLRYKDFPYLPTQIITKSKSKHIYRSSPEISLRTVDANIYKNIYRM